MFFGYHVDTDDIKDDITLVLSEDDDDADHTLPVLTETVLRGKGKHLFIIILRTILYNVHVSITIMLFRILITSVCPIF